MPKDERLPLFSAIAMGYIANKRAARNLAKEPAHQLNAHEKKIVEKAKKNWPKTS